MYTSVGLHPEKSRQDQLMKLHTWTILYPHSRFLVFLELQDPGKCVFGIKTARRNFLLVLRLCQNSFQIFSRTILKFQDDWRCFTIPKFQKIKLKKLKNIEFCRFLRHFELFSATFFSILELKNTSNHLETLRATN